MRYSNILVLLLSICWATLAPAGNAPALNTKRMIRIEGAIGVEILKEIDPLMKLAGDKTGKPIDFVINSPGGAVNAGFLFLNAMDTVRAKGTRIRCFVPQLAASMAFQVLVHCDERYTLNHALLLWHRVRVSLGGGLLSSGTALTGPAAASIAEDLLRTDELMLNELRESLGMDASLVAHHFERETLHTGVQLAASAPDFITAVPYVENLMEAIQGRQLADLGGQDNMSFEPGEIIYIWNGSRNSMGTKP